MSYQLPPPTSSAPLAPVAAVPMPPLGIQTVLAPTPKKGTGLLFTGIGLAVAGIGAGVVLVALSGSTKEETVKNFARAPVGCTTTLEFDKQATFTFYVETKGSVANVEGDCLANGATYNRGSDDLPTVSLTLLDSDDQEVILSSADGPAYSVGEFSGEAVQRVQISAPGTYRLTVISDDSDFAIAVGGDPEADAAKMVAAGVGVAVAGLLSGGVLIFLGLRKRRGVRAPPAPFGYPPPGESPQPGSHGQPLAPPLPGYVPPHTPPTPPSGQGWAAPQQ